MNFVLSLDEINLPLNAQQDNSINVLKVDYYIETQKMSGKKCAAISCQNTSLSAGIMICHKVYHTKVGLENSEDFNWYHLNCFILEPTVEFIGVGVHELRGFEKLPKDRQKEVVLAME